MKQLLSFIAALLLASPVLAHETLVGGKLGGNFNQLSQPTDPAGEPTVLFGTSFTGFGFQAGGTIYRELARLGPGPLFVSADLLFAHQRGSGFAESRTTPARRTLTIHTSGVRLPALIGVGFSGGGSMLNLAVGPELLLGIAAGSKTKQDGGAPVGAELQVRPLTHVGLTAHLGMIFDTSSAKLPIDVRFTWDPFIAKSTRDRFDGFVDYDNTGDYGVAFTWQAVVMVGFLSDVFAKKDKEFTPEGTPEPVEEPPPVPEAEPQEEDPDFGSLGRDPAESRPS